LEIGKHYLLLRETTGDELAHRIVARAIDGLHARYRIRGPYTLHEGRIPSRKGTANAASCITGPWPK
jgi:hypothetical protein